MDAIMLIEEYMGNKPGTIFFSDNLILFKNKQLYSHEQLTLVEANYLKDFPIPKRIIKYNLNEFSSLNTLKNGDSCFCKGMKGMVTILGKCIIENTLRFTIRTKEGDVCVKASDIRKNKSAGDSIQNMVPILKRRCASFTQKFSRKESFTAPNGSNAKLSQSLNSESEYSEIDIQKPEKRNCTNTEFGIYMVDIKYIGNNSNISKFAFIDSFETFKVNDLVKINGEEGLFGRIAFIIITDETEYFVGLTLNRTITEILKAHINDILFEDTRLNKPFHGIIVHSVYIEEFNFPLEISNSLPYINSLSIKFIEELPWDHFTESSIIKVDGNDYGKIKQKLLINNEHCLYIHVIRYGQEINETKIVKTCNTIDVTCLLDEIKFYQGVIISPETIITLEPCHCKYLKKGDEVEFGTRLSSEKYSGIVLDTISINNLPSAIVQLNKMEINESMIMYKCDKDLMNQFNCGDDENLFLVPLSLLHKDKSKELFQILKYMFENDGNWTDGIIDESMAKSDENILSFVIGHIQQDIDIDRSPDLLTTLFDRGDLETLKVLLTKSMLGEKSNLTLLEMAFKCLSNDTLKSELFDVLIDKCSDRNIQLSNKETFLTNLFKTEMPEELIIEIIERNKFDVNKSNAVGETPFILSCEMLLEEVVKVLLKTSLIDHALIAAAGKLIFKSDENQGKRFKIIKLLHPFKDKNICSICMDREIGIVFDCGHVMCEECSTKIDRCPSCGMQPKTRTKIYI